MTARRFWVYIEQEQGEVHPVSWELIGVARTWRHRSRTRRLKPVMR